MKQVLAEIRDGSFAKRWIAESDSGRKEFERFRREDQDHLIERVGAELRSQMRWLDPVEVRAGQAQASAERRPQATASADRGAAESSGRRPQPQSADTGWNP
jgi:ketol-acid reductoisomerase